MEKEHGSDVASRGIDAAEAPRPSAKRESKSIVYDERVGTELILNVVSVAETEYEA